MPRLITNTSVVTIAVGVALTCQVALAATLTDGSTVPEVNKYSAAPAKPTHPYFLYLPDAGFHAFQQSMELNPAWFSRNQSKQTDIVVNNKESENSASLPAPSLFLSQEPRPKTALVIGWLPAKSGTSGPYQPGPYQYATTETKAGGCQTVDRSASNAVETPDSGSKSLHLPAGWLLGMCLHY
jgi:hypothetical protein